MASEFNSDQQDYIGEVVGCYQFFIFRFSFRYIQIISRRHITMNPKSKTKNETHTSGGDRGRIFLPNVSFRSSGKMGNKNKMANVFYEEHSEPTNSYAQRYCSIRNGSSFVSVRRRGVLPLGKPQQNLTFPSLEGRRGRKFDASPKTYIAYHCEHRHHVRMHELKARKRPCECNFKKCAYAWRDNGMERYHEVHSTSFLIQDTEDFPFNLT
jgi:hypothetical protein